MNSATQNLQNFVCRVSSLIKSTDIWKNRPELVDLLTTCLADSIHRLPAKDAWNDGNCDNRLLQERLSVAFEHYGTLRQDLEEVCNRYDSVKWLVNNRSSIVKL